MNQLTQNFTQAQMMSSREIAEVVGSRPVDVNRSIMRLISRGVIDAKAIPDHSTQIDPFAEITVGKAAKLFGIHRSTIYELISGGRIPCQTNGKGHKSILVSSMVARYGQPDTFTPTAQSVGAGVYEYMLDKRSSLVVVAQLCPEFTAAVVDRWQELEAEQLSPAPQASLAPLPDFSNPAAAARAWADEFEQKQQVVARLEAAQPDIDFSQQYGEANETAGKGFRQVCKLLGAKENKFRKFLIDEQIMYQLGGEWMPYSQHKNTGRFCVKAGVSKFNGHPYNTAKFTPKGVKWVAGRWAQYKLGGDA